MNLAYRVAPRVQVGIEYNPVVQEVVPTANWVVHAQTAKWPMISLGTSSDRIGSREGTHTHYVTFARGIGSLRIAPYVTVGYSETDRGLVFPFGMNIELASHWDLLPMYDGHRSHALLTYKQTSYNVSLIWVYLKRAGVSVGLAY